MTDRHTARNRASIDLSPVVPWTNEAGETIPAYGVVQLRTDYDSSSKASKPNSAEGLFFVNGMVSVAAAGRGESLVWDRPRAVLIDGSPSVGAEVGPVSGQWYMDTTGSGFRVLRQPTAGVGVVVQQGGASGVVRAGIVRTRVGSQFYEIELGDLPRSAFGVFSPGCIDCDPCTEVVGVGTDACELTISDPDSIVVGTGEIVTAYDPFSDKIPLVEGTDCVVAQVSASGAMYGYGYGDGQPWVVLTGYHKHLVQYREEWDCCDPTGPPTLIRKTPVILIGTECDPIECGVCP